MPGRRPTTVVVRSWGRTRSSFPIVTVVVHPELNLGKILTRYHSREVAYGFRSLARVRALDEYCSPLSGCERGQDVVLRDPAECRENILVELAGRDSILSTRSNFGVGVPHSLQWPFIRRSRGAGTRLRISRRSTHPARRAADARARSPNRSAFSPPQPPCPARNRK